MSLYSDYLAHVGNKLIHETEDGFATYSLHGQECYIQDVYVRPEKRKQGLSSSGILEVIKAAKAAGCTFLTTTVCTQIKDPTTSLKVVLAMGFQFAAVKDNLIWFKKDIQ